MPASLSDFKHVRIASHAHHSEWRTSIRDVDRGVSGMNSLNLIRPVLDRQDMKNGAY